MAHFLMTNDVECFSFEHNRYEPPVAKRVLEQGLPRLLDLYDKHDVNYQPFVYTHREAGSLPLVSCMPEQRSSVASI
jgi:hypothetical protein